MVATAVVAVVVALACAAALSLYGARRWEATTRALRKRLDDARRAHPMARFHSRELDDVPAPVRRYFQAVLRDGQPIVAAVDIDQLGTFDIGKAVPQWKPFTANQRVVTHRRGFDWNARIAMAPGLSARVHDAYVDGEGLLEASVFGLVRLAHEHGRGDIATGELLRFMAEAAWYPTALLPSQGVRWQAIDERSACATIEDGDVAATLRYTFDDEGLIDTVRADSRGRTVGSDVVPTPWHGHFWNYELRDGMRVPLNGEVAWVLDDGPRLYWRGRIVAIRYEFAR